MLWPAFALPNPFINQATTSRLTSGTTWNIHGNRTKRNLGWNARKPQSKHGRSLRATGSVQDENETKIKEYQPNGSSTVIEPSTYTSSSSIRISGKDAVAAAKRFRSRIKAAAELSNASGSTPTSPLPSTSMPSATGNNASSATSAVEAFRLNKLQIEGKLFLLSAIIGTATGVGITLFKNGIHAVMHLAYGDLIAGNLLPIFHEYNVIFIPLAGGIAVGVLKQLVGNLGGGINEIVSEVGKGVPINAIKPVAKASAAVLTLGSGCSLGPEGPSVEIGASVSRWVSQIFNEPLERQRIYLAAGAAAGVAAGFNAPIAAVFFAQEIVLNASGFFDSRDKTPSSQVITSLLLASSISALIAQIGLGSNPAFKLPLYQIQNPIAELPIFIGLGLVVGVASLAFKAMLRKGKSFFESPLFANVPVNARPAIGGLACGLVAVVFPQILFFGYETLDALLADTNFPLWLLLSLVALKPLMTSISLGSGLVGGTFAPSMFLGATLGASYSKVMQLGYEGFSMFALNAFGPDVVATITNNFSIAGPPAYSIVGMAAALAGVFRAPLTAFLLIFEMTRDYRIVLPLMASVALSAWFVEQYETNQERILKDKQKVKAEEPKLSQSGSRALSKAVSQIPSLELGDRKEGEVAGILESIRVGDCVIRDVIVLDATDSLQTALHRLDAARDRFAIVVHRNEQNVTSLFGVVTLQDIDKLYSVYLASRQSVGNPKDAADAETSSKMSASKNSKASNITNKPIPQPIDSGDMARIKVGDICSSNIVSVYSNSNLLAAYELLENYAIRQLVVFKDEETFDVMGIIDMDTIKTSYRLEETKRSARRIFSSPGDLLKSDAVIDVAKLN